MTTEAIELIHVLKQLQKLSGISTPGIRIGIQVRPYEYRDVVFKLHKAVHGEDPGYEPLDRFTIDHYPFYVIWMDGHEITISRGSNS